ncbi:PAS domain S-box protein [Saccharicrinis sp. 156]|uniref:PAS domain S-box protein n=1 Tax=Saccharicrinis sp. 156 TaxID=3417574 RepID=UPI003D326A90
MDYLNTTKEELILELQKLQQQYRVLQTKYEKEALEQKQKTESLELKEEQCRAILQSTLSGFWRADMQGRLLEVNKAYCQMSGYRQHELLNMRISDLDALENTEDTLAHLQRMRENGGDRFESKHRRKDGSIIDVEVSTQYLDLNGGQIVSFTNDITERKQALNQLVENEQMFREVIQNSPIGKALVKPEGRFMDVNKAFCNMLGYSKEELLNLDFKSITHPEDLNADLIYVRRILDGTISKFQTEKRYVRKDKTVIWALLNVSMLRYDDGRPKFSISQIQDITPRKLSEQALKESEKKYRLIADNMGNVVTVLDMDLNLTYVSPSVKRILGYSPDESLKIGLSGIVHPESMEKIVPVFEERKQKALSGEADFERGLKLEAKFLRKDGTLIWVEIVSSFIRDNNQEPVGILSVSHDISERKKAEQLLLGSEQFYQQIINNTQSGLLVCGLDARYVLWNPAMEKISGIAKEEAIGKHPLELFPFLKEQGVYDLFLKAMGGETVTTPYYPYEVPGSGKSGWGVTDYCPLREINNNIIGVIGSVHEVSDIKKNEMQLKNRVRMEELFNDISYRFVRGSYKECDKLIKASLKKIGMFTRVDRVFVFLYEENGSLISNTHEWNREGLTSQINDLQQLQVDTFPWWTDKMKRFEIINYEDIADLPAEAAYERYVLEKMDVASILSIPMIHEGQLQGIISFYSVKTKKKWLGIDIKILRTLADLICGELARTKRMKELIEAKQNAEENQKKFKKLSNLTFEGILITDNGIILDANNSFTKLSGYTYEDLIGKNVIEMVVPVKYHPVVYKNINKGHAPPYEIEMIRKDGSIIPIEIEGRYIVEDGGESEARVIAVRDIRWRKKVQAEILKLTTAVEQSANMIMITDANGDIQYVNPRFAEVTGYASEEVRGENPRFLRAVEHTQEYHAEMWKTISSGKTWKGVFYNKKKNGDFFYEQATITPIKNDDSEIIHYLAIKEDVTALVESERKLKKQNVELLKAKEKAEESDRLKTSFLANMSHEIRTPMNGILGFTNLLLEPGLDNEDRESFIQLVHQSGQRLLNTVNDIVEISQIESGTVYLKVDDTDVNACVEGLMGLYGPEARKKGLELMVDRLLPVTAKNISTDRTKLDSMLGNLIKNAIKYTESGTINMGCLANGAAIEFYIKDTGIGIPKERQEAVFERFVQADNTDTRAFEGLGVGLAIARSYAQLLGGNIRVESEEGVGSTFYVNLPVKN